MSKQLIITALVIVTVLTSCTQINNQPTPKQTNITGVSTVAENLSVPWEIRWLPNNDILVTQRSGELLRIAKNGTETHNVEGVVHRKNRESGLLGLAIHPNFTTNNYIYLYVTREATNGLTNTVERYSLNENSLTNRTVVIDDIPGAFYHDGGRLSFGPDDKLYITTGDATKENSAQDKDSLSGKILRLNPDGTVPQSNPFNTPIWTYGHRNPQGITWDENKTMWSTEHGRSGTKTGYDEVNRIKAGKNYGWPIIQGPETHPNMTSPISQSGPTTTWAPASAEYYNGSVYFAGLRGATVYEATVHSSIISVNKHVQGRFGRLRTIRIRNGSAYLLTSNTDGRYANQPRYDERFPQDNSDRIIRLPMTSLT